MLCKEIQRWRYDEKIHAFAAGRLCKFQQLQYLLKRETTPLKHQMSSNSDLSYPIDPLEWRITHPPPQGPPSEPQSDQKYH